jgi:hypothetical protein
MFDGGLGDADGLALGGVLGGGDQRGGAEAQRERKAAQRQGQVFSSLIIPPGITRCLPEASGFLKRWQGCSAVALAPYCPALKRASTSRAIFFGVMAQKLWTIQPFRGSISGWMGLSGPNRMITQLCCRNQPLLS